MTSLGIEITLNFYSGRKNPTWIMPTTHAMYKTIRDLFGKARKISEIDLGYCGFTLKLGENTIHIVSDHVAELVLLDVMHKNKKISSKVAKYIRQCIVDKRNTALGM